MAPLISCGDWLVEVDRLGLSRVSDRLATNECELGMAGARKTGGSETRPLRQNGGGRRDDVGLGSGGCWGGRRVRKRYSISVKLRGGLGRSCCWGVGVNRVQQ